MKKAASLVILAAGLLATLPLAQAQQTHKLPRIAFLTSVSPEHSPTAEGFRQGLHDLGYVEGRNIIIEWRSSQGKSELFPAFVTEMMRLNVDVIVVANNLAGLAAHKATKGIPIVFSSGMNDGIAQGFIESLARPGGNITGLANQTPELTGKRLEILKEGIPNLSGVVVLGDPNYGTDYLTESTDMERAAMALGVRIHSQLKASTHAELAGVLAKIPENAGLAVILLSSSTLFFAERAELAEFALKSRLPMMCADRSYVEDGCLISYWPNYRDLSRRAATYVDKILHGVKPADLPVEQPTKFELVINHNTAKALGVDLPAKLLAIADEVIE
jgi:putative ABC transport system substrate-binding protein